MAQHISILENNLYPQIKEQIIKRFSQKNIGLSSLRYEELKDKDYKLSKNDRIFINRRIIKRQEEIFEIHFDTFEHKVHEIFWIK